MTQRRNAESKSYSMGYLPTINTVKSRLGVNICEMNHLHFYYTGTAGNTSATDKTSKKREQPLGMVGSKQDG